MKNIITSIVMDLLLSLFLIGMTSAQPKAVLDRLSYDYGTIFQDSVVTKSFILTNEGNESLKILEVKASCGCTAVVAGKQELNPGESTDIKVSFNSKGKSGKQNKTITIKTNDPINSTILIAFTGTVILPELNNRLNENINLKKK